ncbi:MAG: right-handed parallel beta-helix repeat-containing protein, partial [Phycisphaerales bacterium]
IQEAIDAAADGDRILVLDGTYGGNGNRDIDFGGKAITVRSENGPGYCVIDCQGSPAENHRGFYFHSGEAADSVLEGFTITGGFWDDEGEGGAGICCVGCSPVIRGCIVADNKAYRGGGLYCSDSSATLVDCTIAENEATSRWPGGGMHCDSSALTLSSCSVAKNRPYGIWLYESDLGVFGTIEVTSNNLAGNGTVRLDQAATLEMIGSQVNCEIAGGGTIHVPVGSELTIGSNGTVDLDGPDARGTIRCDGFLKAVDNGAIYNATVEVYRASFEDDSVIVNNVISTQGTGPLAQVVVKGAATIMGNDIHASGDNYIYLDAQLFTGVIEENRIYVTFGEDQSSQDSRLFELRGLDLFCTKRPCEPGMFPLWAVPEFSLDTWTIDRLELGRGVEVTLANRFNFQPPYHSRRDDEVLYVRELVLGPDSVLDMAFNRLYYETLTQDPAANIVNVPLLGFALDKMDFGDADEFFRRVTDNNFEHPLYGRVHVERIEGAAPDPTGLMRMRNLRDNDPASPTWGRIVQSWTKCSFPQLSESRVLIRFEYLFEVEVPGLELLVFLSDVPYLPGPDDLEHRIEVGSVRATLAGRPGSVGSGRFGVFEKWASTESLDLSQGAWITLELQQSEGLESYAASGGAKTELASADSGGGAVLVDGLGPEVHCDGICMDLNWSDAADEEDFLLVIGSCGESSGLLESGTGSRYCLEGAFSSDGFVDAFDIGSWDWTLGDLSRVQGGNFCRVPIPLVDEGVSAMNGAIVKSAAYADRPQLLASGDSTEELLILGKRRTTQYASELLKDRFCAFDASGTYVTDYSKPGLSDRGNIRVVPGNGDDLYLVNSEDGVLQIDGAVEEVIPSGTTSYAGDPRYGRSATVCIGIQGDGSESAGRPILDVAFGADGYAYVVPVVVKPDGKDAYVAAAKLRLLSSAEPPYQVVRLYDDPPLETDNQYRDNLREIEVDSSGNVYVANVHRLNESDKLWQYGPDGTVLRRVELGNPTGDNYIPDPIAMHASDNTGRLYLASALYNSADADSTIIHSFSLDNLAREGSITIRGIQHVTGITEEPGTGDLWVVGFTMAEIPAWPDPTKPPFYEPYLAKVPRDVDTVQASSIVDSGSHDLALPMSIVWTGASDCLPSCHEDHAEWVAVGRPDCWCYPRQCHGDADGQKAGSSKTGYYHVGPTDLNVLLSAWLVKEPPYGLGIASVPDGICADFAHDEGGSTKTGRYRVGPSDLNIMIANWLIKEPPHGPDVPADCSDCP